MSNFGLFLTDKKILLGTDWLDNIINACQQLLQKQFSLQGLQSPQCGRNLTVKVVPLSKIYIQILHVNSNHWIATTNFDTSADKVFDDRILIYDSGHANKITSEIQQQVCSFTRPSAKIFKFDVMDTMTQPNLSDCGVFAIANATEIAFRFNPVKCVWDLRNARRHLIRCLEGGKMERFPIVKQRRVPFGRAIKTYKEEEIHCVCRMPFKKNVASMIQCSFCRVWFHSVCVDIVNVNDYSGDTKWFCSKCDKLFQM